MKSLAIAVVLVLVSLGVVAGAVFGLGDDEVLVSPPENVAQEFVWAVSLGQTGAASEMLSRDARRRTPSAELQRISKDFRARIGRLDDVQGTVAERAGDTAIVRAHVQGERGNAEPSLLLVRESGEWAVVRPGDVLEGRQ
jgi:hypothetical protein